MISPKRTERDCDSPSPTLSSKKGGFGGSTLSQGPFNQQKETVFSELESDLRENYDGQGDPT